MDNKGKQTEDFSWLQVIVVIGFLTAMFFLFGTIEMNGL